MRFIDKEPVHAKLFKSNHIVLAALGLQFFQPSLQGFSGSFQLLDGKPVPLGLREDSGPVSEDKTPGICAA